ncbi:GntP family permease [Brachyspira aalborgi]|jgi:H+/gluconate symporter-like permease|uniref:GntP family permease n=1 Tax=Brachyspira aalborgi TaxID=29522 RepID=A0A5C8CQ38_9SPIR|nr:GntP family permease [Brachyspira aalborgi]TXJ15410.1 GntP family permease [Brachyspira aalborgi]TXJ17953.1 GntP family permease [Brachyspira aalborgi]TXJ37904.1 GntP family permease [Brachyspira aalborgi]TXJ43737.1 GntP family permease [Brachyspira aalborgi]TXJ52500.1 GntP family permease [Brachyspira aalborgi]
MLGILLGLICLAFLTYKGMSILWVAPVSALVVAAFGGMNLLDAFTGDFMKAFGGYATSWFPMFMLGAIFGKVMEVTGAAESIAHFLAKKIGYKRAIIAVVVICGVLTYGGVSLFVVVFVMYPMGLALFREANLPRKMLPGSIALGAFAFTMTAFPGTPQLTNVIPATYFGTGPMSAPVIGIICGILMFILGILWLQYRTKKLQAAGEVFDEPEGETTAGVSNPEDLPKWYLAIIPPLLIIILFNAVKLNIVVALLVGVLAGIIIFIRRLKTFGNVIKTLNDGASGSMLAILNTAAGVGFGGVIKAVPGFEQLKTLVTGIDASPLISEAIAINVLAGATGSSSGGVSIVLEALGPQFIELAKQSGIALEVFSRVASISAGGLDTLPQCGAVLTVLAVTKLTHKDSYIDIFMCCTVIPISATILAIILGTLGVV